MALVRAQLAALEPRADPLRVRAPPRVLPLAASTATCSRCCARAGSSSASTCCSSPDVWLTAPAPGRIRIGGGTLPQPRRAGRRGRAGRDRRALHVRQRLLRHRRQPPLRRPRQAGAVAGLHRPRARRASATTSGAARTSSITSGVTIGERCVIGANSRRHHRPAAALDRRRRARAACSARSSTRALVLREHDRARRARRRRRTRSSDHAPARRRPRPRRRAPVAARLGRAAGAEHDERERRR